MKLREAHFMFNRGHFKPSELRISVDGERITDTGYGHNDEIKVFRIQDESLYGSVVVVAKNPGAEYISLAHYERFDDHVSKAEEYLQADARHAPELYHEWKDLDAKELAEKFLNYIGEVELPYEEM